MNPLQSHPELEKNRIQARLLALTASVVPVIVFGGIGFFLDWWQQTAKHPFLIIGLVLAFISTNVIVLMQAKKRLTAT